MRSWVRYLRDGFSRSLSADRIARPPAGSVRASLGNLKPFLRRHWPRAALGIVLVLIATLLSLPTPLITRFVVDKVILAKQLRWLLWAVGGMALLSGLNIVVGAAQNFFFSRFEQEVLLDIQSHLLDRTLRFPKTFFDDKEVGYLMSRLLADVQGLRFFFSSTLVYIGTAILRVVAGACLLIYLEWRLGLIVMMVVPAMYVAARFFGRHLRVLSHRGMEQQAQVSRTLEESLAATSLIKAFASEERAVRGLMAELRGAFTVGMEQVSVTSAARLATGLIPEIARGITLLLGAYWVVQGQWTLGSLLAFQVYLTFLFYPTQYLADAAFSYQNARAALERVSALFNIVPEEANGSGTPVEKLRGEVEMRDVAFSYDGTEQVLDGISFRVAPGERVALVGPSGVGKTTLISLILRFYRPGRGELLFDGAPAESYELASLRRRIGYVSQNPVLLSGTIADNLRYGHPDATDAELERAALAAGIHDFIAAQAGGYAAPVGERGANLSDGQRQRVALARALVKDPDILVLDEPTSALDSTTERSIMDALPALVAGKTVFIVAHRLATVQHADRIMLLKDNGLADSGTHQELLARSEYYRALVANQQVLS